MIDYNAGQFWFTVIQLIITVSGWVYAGWTNRNKVTSARFVEIEGRMGVVESQANTIEDKIKRLPACDNHARMEANDEKLFKRLASLHGDIRELTGEVKTVVKQLDLVQEHLLNG